MGENPVSARINDPPFHRFLAMQVEHVDEGTGVVRLRLPYQPVFARSATVPQIHGGVTAAFIDIVGDYALVALIGNAVPTLHLSVDFLRMATDTALIGTAKVVKAGRSVGVVDVEVHDEQGRLIAIGRGTYSIAAANATSDAPPPG